MNDKLADVLACECDRLQAELTSTSQKDIFPEIQKKLTTLRTKIRNDWKCLTVNEIIEPFAEIVENDMATDVITCIALSSLNTLIINSVFTEEAHGSMICDMLLSCSFQTTSSYDCSCVSQRILICIHNMCIYKLMNPESLSRAMNYVIEEIYEHENPSVSLTDILVTLVESILKGKCEEAMNQCIINLFYLSDMSQKKTSPGIRNAGMCGLLRALSFVEQSGSTFESLLIAACVLIHQQLEQRNDSRDNFVLVLRLYFGVFKNTYLNYIVPFAHSFEFLLDFLGDATKPTTKRSCVMNVITDFVVLDGFVFSVYANLHNRPQFPDLFSKMTKNIFEYGSFEVSKMLFSLIPECSTYDLQKEKQEHDDLKVFVEQFNAKSSQFCNRELYTPSDIAKRLFIAPDLSRQNLGEFFGKNKDFCIETLEAFLALFDFSSLDFDSSIRTFLASFHIAGEGQIVDRIFGLFAKYFYAGHKDSKQFSSAEALHVLAYGWLMVHTAIYNNNVAKKPAFQDFQKMLARQNDGSDFDPHMMEFLYNSIKRSQIPVQDNEQIGTMGGWRLLLQKQRLMNLEIVKSTEKGGEKLCIDMFDTVWSSSSQILLAHAEKTHNKDVYMVLSGCIETAAEHGMTDMVDDIVQKFAKFSMKDLEEDTVTDSFAFLVSVIQKNARYIRKGWKFYLELLITMFQLDLLPEEILTFNDVFMENEKTVLGQRLLNKKTRKTSSSSMFSRFIAKKSGSDGDIGKVSLQTELRDFVLKTNCHHLFNQSCQLDKETIERIITVIFEYSNDLDASPEGSPLLMAFCCLITEKLCEAGSCVTDTVEKYYRKMLHAGVHPFVQSITLGMCFLILDKLMETQILDWIAQIDQNSLQHNYQLIETGLSVFLNNHFTEFAAKMHWKSIMKLLGCGIAMNSEASRNMLDRLMDTVESLETKDVDFDQFWLPIVQIEISLLASEKSNTSEQSIKLQTVLLSADLKVHEWCDVFNTSFFPALAYLGTKRVRGAAALHTTKIAMNTFLYALPKFKQSPLFESIWFRILGLTLELSKGGNQEFAEEMPEIFSNALRVMQTSGAFDDKSSKIWQLTKQNIERHFPGIMKE